MRNRVKRVRERYVKERSEREVDRGKQRGRKGRI